jgi:acyl-CoA synthetase (AMP-forming)/AMP-acid ligase II
MDIFKFNNKIAALQDDGETVTYKELDDFSRQVGHIIGERCLAFILCRNTIGSLASYLACLDNKIVPLLLDSSLDRELLINLQKTYKPQYIFMPADLTNEDNLVTFEKYLYTIIKTNFDEKHSLNNDLALLLTTSGSTGSPKVVRLSCENIRSNAESIVQYLELNDSERPITTLPMHYSYGLSIINSHLAVGATILLTGKSLMQKEFWKFLKTEGATSFAGVPYTYEILNKLRFIRMDLPSLRSMTQAGGKLSLELHRHFAQYASEKSKRFFVMYGQTEATARMAYLPYEKSLEKCGSMGIAVPGGELTLIDTDGKEIIASDVMGELVYRGPNVTLGYAECGADLAKGNERHGVLATGDMAKRDADGFYYILYRKKRFLKIFGNRVNLDETEQMIKSAFPKLDCACAGTDDNMYIFLTNKEIAPEVKTYISEKTKLNPSAFKTVVIDNIPKNEAGKTLYVKLAKYYDGL